MSFFLAAALAAALAAGLASPPPQRQIDLGRYFPSAAAEERDRRELMAALDVFTRSQTPRDGSGLGAWLARADALRVRLRKHDVYVYLRAERDVDDTPDAKADDEMGRLENRLDARIEDQVAALGAKRVQALTAQPSALGAYAFFVRQTFDRARHRLPADAKTAGALAADVGSATGTSYRALRRQVLAAPIPTPGSSSAASAFRSRYEPFAAQQDAFAAQLLTLVRLGNGVARLRNFPDAAAAAYFDKSLSQQSVARALAAVRASNAGREYQDVLRALAARRLGIAPAAVHVYDLSTAVAFDPPSLSVPETLATILAAERPMGGEYAAAYAQLFDPNAGRLELCTAPRCDATGFSLGFKGTQSAVFVGGPFAGTPNDVRKLAHEAGHAIHRQFMNAGQPIPTYNSGPTFLFESFAIFNELLLWDYRRASATTPQARAYYLKQFLDDATFQIYGSAAETDLEAQIYAGTADRSLKTAADLNALTLRVFARYDPLQAAEPAVASYWARDELFFTDPLYDVSYLYAGLLALNYFERFETDRGGFAKAYVALLKNGFDDTPGALEHRFLHIDLNDERGLSATADRLIEQRTRELAAGEGT
jgi:oligoendopeptidase F